MPGHSGWLAVFGVIGALMALLNERRLKLEAEGLFSPERKRPLPFMPRTIGIVTSVFTAVTVGVLVGELVEVAVLVDLLPVHEAHRDGAPGRELALAVLEKAVRVSHGKPP